LGDDLATRQDRALAPFRALPAAGVAAPMLAHLPVPARGDGLTSLRPPTTRLLREAGFTGAVLTDARDMGAVLERTGDIGEAAVQALLAGADLLCLGSPAHVDEGTFRHVVATLAAAVESEIGRASCRDTG